MTSPTSPGESTAQPALGERRATGRAATHAATLVLLLLAGLELGNAVYVGLLRTPPPFPAAFDLGLPEGESMPLRHEDSEAPRSFWYSALRSPLPTGDRDFSLALWVSPAAGGDAARLEMRLGNPPLHLVASVSSLVEPGLETRPPAGTGFPVTAAPPAGGEAVDGPEHGRRFLLRWHSNHLTFRAGSAEAGVGTPPGWTPGPVALTANHAPLRLHRLWGRSETAGRPAGPPDTLTFTFEPGGTGLGAQALVTAAGLLTVFALWLLPMALVRLLEGPAPPDASAGPAGPRLALLLASAILAARFATFLPAWDVPPVHARSLALTLGLALAVWLVSYRRRFVGDPWTGAVTAFAPAPAGRLSSLGLLLFVGLPAAALVLTWRCEHLDVDSLAPALFWPAAAACAVFPLILTRAGPWRVPRAWLLALPSLLLGALAAAAPSLGWTSDGPMRLLPHAWVATAALWQLAVLLTYQDFLRPASLVLLAPLLLATATAESGIKTFLGPHPFMGDCIFWYAEMEPESLHIHNFRGSLFRGREVDPDKGERFRILVLGGSVVFGASLPWGADYPTQLQPALDRTASGRQVEVLNAGIPAFTSEMGLALLREKLLRLQPDLVISAWGVNDMAGNGEGPGLDRTFLGRERWVAAHPWLGAARDATRQSGLYLWLRRLLLQKWLCTPDGTFEPTPGAGRRVTPDQFEENLHALARLGEAHRFRVAYTLDVHASELDVPCDDPRSRNWGGDAGRIVRQVARDEDRPWLDARLAFCGPGIVPSELFIDGLHLTERGCTLMAKELARQLRAAGLVDDLLPPPPGMPVPPGGH